MTIDQEIDEAIKRQASLKRIKADSARRQMSAAVEAFASNDMTYEEARVAFDAAWERRKAVL